MKSFRNLRNREAIRFFQLPLLKTDFSPRNSFGAALILVLGMLSLLSCVILIFASVAIHEESTANASTAAARNKITLFSALGLLLGDLKSEVLAGSIPVNLPQENCPQILYPATADNNLPACAGKTVNLPPNLLKQSAANVAFFPTNLTRGPQLCYPDASTYPPSSRASDISTITPSSNGRFIPKARWNRAVFIPRLNPESSSDKSPSEEGSVTLGSLKLDWQWIPPDWVLLQNDGAPPNSWTQRNRWKPQNPTSVQNRFAYQIYDTGGLLDINVAGYSAAFTPISKTARKGSPALADLSQIGLSETLLKNLIGWRNQETLQQPDAPPFGDRYLNFLFSGPANQDFLRAAQYPSLGHRSRSHASNHPVISRTQLEDRLLSLSSQSDHHASILNSLQYLTHFSRSLEQPSVHPGAWDPSGTVRIRPRIVPPAGNGDSAYVNTQSPPDFALGNNYRGGNDAAYGDEIINPSFLEIRVTIPFTRANGQAALVGKEPLVLNRFALTRLNWLTHMGPSASLNKTSPQYDPNGTALHIQSCFGLRWDPRHSSWIYDHGIYSTASGKAVKIATLKEIQSAGREADFFELLKAAIVAGSLGKAAAFDHPHSPENPYTVNDSASYQQQRDRSIDLQILQIGANLIDQYDADDFPTILTLQNHIPSASSPNPLPSTIRGVEDLPYFNRLHLIGIPNSQDEPSPRAAAAYPVEITDELESFKSYNCGTTSILALPEIWNPHAINTSIKPRDSPKHFRCTAVSEDPEQMYAIGNPLWRAENRFKIRPNVAFAALRHANDPASVFFENRWPNINGPASISNALAPSRGFWIDLYNNFWDTPTPPRDIYSIQCYPFYKLPYDADPNTFPSNPSPLFHVDRYYQELKGTPLYPRFFALGEKNAPLQTVPLGSSQVEIDVRGSELLFEIDRPSSFREPTTLCKPSQPAGTNLRAGPGHWLSRPEFSGRIKGAIEEAGSASTNSEPAKWLGFSMGERPTTWIVAAKVVNQNMVGIEADQYGWDATRGPRESSKYVGTYKFPGNLESPPATLGATGYGWYNSNLCPKPKVSLWRFLQVTANTVNIQPTLLTVRLQYLSPQNGLWITYDEHYIQCEGDFNSRLNYRQHPHDNDGSGKSWFCSDPHKRSDAIPWTHNPTGSGNKVIGASELSYGHPAVHCYDPRTSRFGHPISPAFVGFSFFGTTPDWPDSSPIDRWVDPLPSPDGQITGFPLLKSGPLTQSGTTQRPSSFSPRQTAVHMVPGGYSGTHTNPTTIGWFPNKIWDSNNLHIIQPGIGPRKIEPLQPPRFSDSPWLMGGQSGNPTILRPGWLVENQATPLHQYYADADDIVRRASGAYAEAAPFHNTSPPLNSEDGLAPTQSLNDVQRKSRPIILNRPFQSVTEMSYAFRGTPWKHIDFFTPESGDSALLDVFCISEHCSASPLMAGKTNLNTRQPPVLRALISGALKDELHIENILTSSPSGEAQLTATRLLQHTLGTEFWEGPFGNVSELSGKLLGKNITPVPPPPSLSATQPFYTYTIPFDRPDGGAWSYTGFSSELDAVFPKLSDRKIQRIRESVLRSLVDSTQTRVWNLMIDLILQTGKYPASATNGADFVVEAESRVWLHLALDRLTGETLDQQIEWVSE